jgi:hypothetical protein
MHRENRRALLNRFPIGHLDEPAKKLILAGGKPDRPLYEVATYGALRDRLRSGDIWVEGSRAYRPLDEYLMSTGAFTEKKDADPKWFERYQFADIGPAIRRAAAGS